MIDMHRILQLRNMMMAEFSEASSDFQVTMRLAFWSGFQAALEVVAEREGLAFRHEVELFQLDVTKSADQARARLLMGSLRRIGL